MLGQRQKFEVREPHLLHVFRKQRRYFPITQPPAALFRDAAPRSEVDFINRYRRIQGASAAAFLHPLLIPPFVVEIPNDRTRARRRFGMKSKRVCFVDAVIMVTGYHMVFVNVPLSYVGNKSLPDSR